jgi:inhibitor of cysteine peptidase
VHEASLDAVTQSERKDVMLALDSSANGTTIQLTIGDEVRIELAENRTTGFRWSLADAGTPVLQLLHDDTSAPAGPPGAGGRRSWHFRCVAAGSGRIELVHKRSWEQLNPAETFIVNVSAG